MLARAASGSISRPNAVGLIEMFASILFSIIESISVEYSSMKNSASTIEMISSPRTSTVKQAPSSLISRIREIALCMSEPATYLFETQRMKAFGVIGIKPTTNCPNSLIYTLEGWTRLHNCESQLSSFPRLTGTPNSAKRLRIAVRCQPLKDFLSR